jgi:hypothetical protein
MDMATPERMYRGASYSLRKACEEILEKGGPNDGPLVGLPAEPLNTCLRALDELDRMVGISVEGKTVLARRLGEAFISGSGLLTGMIGGAANSKQPVKQALH